MCFIIFTYSANYIYCTNYSMVSAELGLADFVWQNKRAAIAQEIDGLGAQFRPALHDGWLKYINATYAAQPEPEEAGAGPPIAQGNVAVDDD